MSGIPATVICQIEKGDGVTPDKEQFMLGRLAALEYLMTLVFEASPAARQALANITPDLLEGNMLPMPISEASSKGYVAGIQGLQRSLGIQIK